MLISQGGQTLEPYENTSQKLQAMEDLHENPSSLRWAPVCFHPQPQISLIRLLPICRFFTWPWPVYCKTQQNYISASQMVGLVFWLEELQLVLEILDLGLLSRESQVYVPANTSLSLTSQASNIKTLPSVAECGTVDIPIKSKCPRDVKCKP